MKTTTPTLNNVAKLAVNPPEPLFIQVANGNNPDFDKQVRNLQDEHKVALLKELIEVYQERLSLIFDQKRNETKEIEEITEFLEKVTGSKIPHCFRLQYTLARQGQQFRCWLEPVTWVRAEHVDSGGGGLLFHLGGPADKVMSAVRELLTPQQLDHAIKLPIGVFLYDVVRWR